MLDQIRDGILAQEETLKQVATIYADAIEDGGLIHVYANGHSRLAVEEMVIRMGSLSGFHPILSVGLTTFTDVVGANGVRVNQAIEKVEGLGATLLNEFDIGPKDALISISAIFNPNRRNSSMAKNIFFTFSFTIVYWLLYSSTITFGMSGKIPPALAAFTIPAVCATFVLFRFYRHRNL